MVLSDGIVFAQMSHSGGMMENMQGMGMMMGGMMYGQGSMSSGSQKK